MPVIAEPDTQALAVPIDRFADVGPGRWWFVHHPDGYLIEVGLSEPRALQLAEEINAGRAIIKEETKP